jgi:hypothetical protein
MNLRTWASALRAGRRSEKPEFRPRNRKLQGGIRLAKSPVPTAGRAGSPLPAASHDRFAALRGLSALPRIELDETLRKSLDPFFALYFFTAPD